MEALYSCRFWQKEDLEYHEVQEAKRNLRIAANVDCLLLEGLQRKHVKHSQVLVR